VTAEEKLAMIRDMCQHPGSYHWSGQEMAAAITRVINGEKPIPYRLSDADEPIPYTLVHDAVYEEIE
jgi:hypothetical protein